MLGQNINNYYSNKYKLRLNNSSYFDLTLSSDEVNYDDEVIFSENIIAENDGNRMPINIDLNSELSSQKNTLVFHDIFPTNVIVSKNIYNPNNEDLSCKNPTTLCDIGLTGTDNGLYDKMSGETLTFTMGVNDDEKFNPHYFDRRFKMNSVGTHANYPNGRFQPNQKTVYNIVSKNNDKVGYYNELYGGFYQGFYKLYGYDYEVFPERVNKGWTAEMMLKPRQRDEFQCPDGVYLNDVYPNNSGTFFFFGARAENKFYHPTTGSTLSPYVSSNNFLSKDCFFNFRIIEDTGNTMTYSAITSNLDCLESCSCGVTGDTNSNCIPIFPSVEEVISGGCNNMSYETPPTDPAMDMFSNAMSIRFKGDPKNPNLCVKYMKVTGDCVTTTYCEESNTTYLTGYTIQELCSTKGIYDDCNYDNLLCADTNTEERWVMVSAVFERYKTLEDCDLLNWGGLGDIRDFLYPSSINKQSQNLISPPHTHPTGEKEILQNFTTINKKWLRNDDKRRGDLKIYVNGFLFMVIENFEEIIPRELNTQKEKQLGVPFNISFGGGTQGLREHLMFKSCEQTMGPYIQDPELLPNETVFNSPFENLETNIIMEQNFGGTFMGGISQFRMYTEPLSTPQLQHNFRVLKDKFDLYDVWCPNCYGCLLECHFDFDITEGGSCDIDFELCEVSCDFDVVINDITCNFNFEIVQ
jgi:hypothetical protein